MKSNADLGLHQIGVGQAMTVLAVAHCEHAPEWSQWLQELGFLPGEQVQIMAKGFPSGDPMVVRVGLSTFALRTAEAACVRVVVNHVGDGA